MGRFRASLGLVLALSVHAAAAEPDEPPPLKWVRPNKSPIVVPRDAISRLDVRRRERVGIQATRHRGIGLSVSLKF